MILLVTRLSISLMETKVQRNIFTQVKIYILYFSIVSKNRFYSLDVITGLSLFYQNCETLIEHSLILLVSNVEKRCENVQKNIIRLRIVRCDASIEFKVSAV